MKYLTDCVYDIVKSVDSKITITMMMTENEYLDFCRKVNIDPENDGSDLYSIKLRDCSSIMHESEILYMTPDGNIITYLQEEYNNDELFLFIDEIVSGLNSEMVEDVKNENDCLTCTFLLHMNKILIEIPLF